MERKLIMEMNNQPLVSVPVITYNSSKFVLETLESIKAQTYQNIELIISDDCSTDNTVELCQKWVEKNKERFVRTQIITSEINTGVSANLNRAEAACQGDWVKGIAGDDLLMPDCIESCVNYAVRHNVTCLFGKIKAFGSSVQKNMYIENNIFNYSFFYLSDIEQWRYLIFNKNCVPAATYFYNRSKIIDLGITNDERIPLMEDWPKWINITRSGIKLQLIDKLLVFYRISENSLSTTDSPSLRFQQSHSKLYVYYLFVPRFHSHKSIYKKLGEVRKYIHHAHKAFGGLWWETLIKLDYLIAKLLISLGCKIKI